MSFCVGRFFLGQFLDVRSLNPNPPKAKDAHHIRDEIN